MIDRLKEIDLFLKELAKEPEEYRKKSNVYGALVKYDYTDEEMAAEEIDEREYYDTVWMANNIRHWFYEAINDNGFYQFNDRGVLENHDEIKYDEIKLYLSIDFERILEIFTDILDMFYKENILQVSKISHYIRSDDCVLRVYSKEDAVKTIDFINKKFSDVITKKTNPFLLRKGVVGVATDRSESFNSYVANYISSYIRKLNNDNNLEEAGLESFITYIKQLKQNLYENAVGIEEFLNSINKDIDDIDILVNNYMIMETLLISLDKDKSLDDLFAYYEKERSSKYRDGIKKSIKKLVKEKGVIVEDWHDREYVLYALENDISINDDIIKSEFAKDPEIISLLIKKDGKYIEIADPELLSDQSLVLEALKTYPKAFRFADDSTKANRNVVINIVKQDGSMLKYAHKKLQADFDVVLEAVKNSGFSLKYADENLKENEKIVKTALNNASYAYYAAGPIIRNNTDFFREIMEENENIICEIEYAGPKIKKSKEIVKECLLRYVSAEIDNIDLDRIVFKYSDEYQKDELLGNESLKLKIFEEAYEWYLAEIDDTLSEDESFLCNVMIESGFMDVLNKKLSELPDYDSFSINNTYK